MKKLLLVIAIIALLLGIWIWQGKNLDLKKIGNLQTPSSMITSSVDKNSVASDYSNLMQAGNPPPANEIADNLKVQIEQSINQGSNLSKTTQELAKELNLVSTDTANPTIKIDDKQKIAEVISELTQYLYCKNFVTQYETKHPNIEEKLKLLPNN